jgi:hypothetical protein
MATPLIFITTITVMEGTLEDFKHYSEEMGKFVVANVPRIIHFEQYINEDGTELTSVQIHPDEDSMMFHMQVAAERMGQAYEFIDAIKSLQIYGEPSDAFVEQMKPSSEAGFPVIVKSKFAGFNRLSATAASEPANSRNFAGTEFSEVALSSQPSLQ